VADRYGPKRIYRVLLVTEGPAVAGYTVVNGLLPFVIAAVSAITANRSTAGVRNGFIATVASPHSRTRLRAYLRPVTNTGAALGAGLAGLALIHPTRPVPACYCSPTPSRS